MDQGGGDDDDADDVLSPSHQLDLSPRMMMRGRETKTRFSGSGIYANVVAQVCSPDAPRRIHTVLFLTHYDSSFLTSEPLLKKFAWQIQSSHG
jgi:hypothetical protein